MLHHVFLSSLSDRKTFSSSSVWLLGICSVTTRPAYLCEHFSPVWILFFIKYTQTVQTHSSDGAAVTHTDSSSAAGLHQGLFKNFAFIQF